MRTLIGISMVVLLIVVSSLLSFNMLTNQTDTMYKNLLILEDNLQHENWDKAFETYKSLNENWEKSKQTWPMLIDHLEIDSINLAMAELNAFIKTREDAEARSKVYALKVLMKHIPEKEAFNLKNVL